LVASGFYPASSEARADVFHNPVDVFSKYKDKCLKIGQESDWLLDNGSQVDWQVNGREKYVRLFRDIGIATVRGTRCDSKALISTVYEYWGGEFLDALFEETPVFPKWLSQIHACMMNRFLPLQHILLMCVAKGSAKDFVECDVSEHPFGVGLFPCENPICTHYHTDVADCIEVCNYNSRVVCFLCLAAKQAKTTPATTDTSSSSIFGSLPTRVISADSCMANLPSRHFLPRRLNRARYISANSRSISSAVL